MLHVEENKSNLISQFSGKYNNGGFTKCTDLLGFPISRLILHHSALCNFLVFSSGNDSLIQIQKSFSPRKRGLQFRIFFLLAGDNIIYWSLQTSACISKQSDKEENFKINVHVRIRYFCANLPVQVGVKPFVTDPLMRFGQLEQVSQSNTDGLRRPFVRGAKYPSL